MDKDYVIDVYQKVIIGGIALCLILVSMIVALLSELTGMQKVINCDTFGSQKEAIKYLGLFPDLDRDHDGKPCEKFSQ